MFAMVTGMPDRVYGAKVYARRFAGEVLLDRVYGAKVYARRFAGGVLQFQTTVALDSRVLG